jgi:hypothetical protein
MPPKRSGAIRRCLARAKIDRSSTLSAEVMEAAEVPESTKKLIIGHKRASLTYGHYSRGQRVKLRESINKLRYGDEVMRLIRGGSAPVTRQKRKRRAQRKAKA